ncbi:MAG: Mrp/NBP35 family ATP-binding protein [Treponema sp.]|nr:Mrp/NBP35 family ATP-binding protein [Treponema sp.]
MAQSEKKAGQSDSGCTHNCSTCGASCKSKDMRAQLRAGSCVKKVIGVVSGKGGVGKSLVTSLLAAKFSKLGKRVAVLDADITGPSIPTSFGVAEEKAMGDKSGAIYPVETKSGIQLMSMNFLLEHETDPVFWRGPVIAGAVKQFWTDVVWKDVDYMFVDMPPGTGDVPLTVFQSLPVDGIIVVSSPQQLVRVIVEKAVKMAEEMKIPILGLIENMSYVTCPDCNKEIYIYGKSNIDEIAMNYHLPVLARIPISEEISRAVDEGEIEMLQADFMEPTARIIEDLH